MAPLSFVIVMTLPKGRRQERIYIHKSCARHVFRDHFMKKSLVLFAMVAFMLPTFAQTRVGEINDWDGVVPSCFTNGETYVACYGGDESYDDSLYLINNNLQIVKTFTNRSILSKIREVNYWDVDIVAETEVEHIVSQNFFNNDDLWEFVVVAEADTVYDNWGYHYVNPRAYSAVQENGNVLFTLTVDDEIPESSNYSQLQLRLAKWNNVNYIVCSCYWGDEYVEENYKMVLYRVSQSTQSIERVDGELPMRVFPSPAGHSQDITVELGDNTSASEVEVINSLGQTIQRIPVQPGQREVKINTSKMGSGVHFVHRKGHKAAKIIVR